MDAFYASIEQRDNPKLKGKPVAVGHGGKRGVVAAASYEARRYGVRSAMSSVKAKLKCPSLIFVPPHAEAYRSVSEQIMNIFRDYTDLVEPLSLDEAFLDVTQNKKKMQSATLIAKEIKQKIKEKTALTASAGISFNKFLAKIASDYDKPDGLYLIPPQKAERFIEKLPIEKFFGVGKVTAKKMKQLGIKTGHDLKQWNKPELVRHFGKTGKAYYSFAHGIDNREVQPIRIRKSLSVEKTFYEDLYHPVDLKNVLQSLAKELQYRTEKKQFLARTLTLKVKYTDFKIITRSNTTEHVINSYNDIFSIANTLLSQVEKGRNRKIRLVGITLKKTNAERILPPTLPIQLRIDFHEKG